MQTASGTLTAAITAKERAPKTQLLIDWDNDGTFVQTIDDQSARVETIQIDRTITTDLPDAVNLLAGYSVATASVTLGGNPANEADTAPSYYSPYATTSPIYGKRRRWRTALLALGFTGTAGAELLTVFTGKTRSLATTGGTRSADLELFDNTELMRGVVDVPLVVANASGAIHPGLNASWVADYIARACGFYAAPPRRTGCVLEASLAGSGYPALGTHIGGGAVAGGTVAFGASGKFIQGMLSSAVQYNLASTLTLNNGGELLIEGWVNVVAGAQGLCQIYASGSSPVVEIDLTLNASGVLQTNIRRSGATFTGYSSGLTVPTGVWTYVAVHVSFSSTTTTIQWRVGSSSNSTSAATASVTGQPALTSAWVGQGWDATGLQNLSTNCGFEAWQVSNPGIGTGTPTWNNAYVGNSIIQASLNALTATVPSTASAWEQIQQIAAAEMATAGFDEAGRFTFYTRSRWTSAPFTTSQRTIDASSLKDLTVTEATDQVRNRIRATASPAVLQKTGFVWRSADIVSVPASGSTTVVATFENPATGIATTIANSAANNPTANYYRANRNSDGSGTTVTNLTFTVTLTSTTATIVITNPNAFVVYLVNPPGFSDAQGTPALGLWGQAVLYAQSSVPDTTTAGFTVPTQTIYDVKDATSIGQHGEQLLEIPVNPWLQDGASLATLVADLLARLKDPPPVVTGLSIPYDPRLQLGDRVTVVADQFGLSADFFLIGSHVNVSVGGGATQALDTRAV